MNIVILMAGRGTRFATDPLGPPKPLAIVAGCPMVAWVIEGIRDLLDADARLIFVALEEHDRRFGIRATVGPHVRHPFEVIFGTAEAAATFTARQFANKLGL